MRIILKLKHWQVFVILLLISFTSNFEWTGHDSFNLAMSMFGVIFYLLWYFAVGIELTEHLPPAIKVGKRMFIISACVLMLSILILIAIFDGQFSSDGFAGFMWVGYLFHAAVQFMLVPSRVLKPVEQKAQSRFNQCFGYFLLMLFWPVGIWWMQPKLNRIAKLNEEPWYK